MDIHDINQAVTDLLMLMLKDPSTPLGNKGAANRLVVSASIPTSGEVVISYGLARPSKKPAPASERLVAMMLRKGEKEEIVLEFMKDVHIPNTYEYGTKRYELQADVLANAIAGYLSSEIDPGDYAKKQNK